MTSSDRITPPLCPNGHPVTFAGQRFCEVCRSPIGAPAKPAAPKPGGLPAARGASRATPPLLLGLAVCLVMVALAVFVVAKPFGGSPASPPLATGTVLVSPAVTPSATGTALASASTAARVPPAPTNFTATRKNGSVPCPSADESCSETDLAWRSSADPETWFRVYWAGTGEDPAATCQTVQAQATTRLDTEPAARTVQVFDPMALGGGQICYWITAVNSTGESAQVAAASNNVSP